MATIGLNEEEKQIFDSDLDAKIDRPKKKLPSGPVPPYYVCNKCHVKGHWIHQCPGIVDINGKLVNIKNVRRPTGIPTTYLTEVDASTPNSYITSDGRYVINTGTLLALKRSESFIKKKEQNQQFPKKNPPISRKISCVDRSIVCDLRNAPCYDQTYYGNCTINDTVTEKQKEFQKGAKYKSTLEEVKSCNVDKLAEQEVPEWSLDKSLENEIKEIIMMGDDADLTDDIFSLSNMENKLMLTTEDYDAARAKKAEQYLNGIIGQSNVVDGDYQEISVVNFSNEDPFPFEVDLDLYPNQQASNQDDNVGIFHRNDAVFVPESCNELFERKEDENDKLQRQLETEFLNKIGNTPLKKTKSKYVDSKPVKKSYGKTSHHKHTKEKTSHRENHLLRKSSHSGSKYSKEIFKMIRHEKDTHRNVCNEKSKLGDSNYGNTKHYKRSHSRSHSLVNYDKSRSEKGKARRELQKDDYACERSSNRSDYSKDRTVRHKTNRDSERRNPFHETVQRKSGSKHYKERDLSNITGEDPPRKVYYLHEKDRVRSRSHKGSKHHIFEVEKSKVDRHRHRTKERNKNRSRSKSNNHKNTKIKTKENLSKMECKKETGFSTSISPKIYNKVTKPDIEEDLWIKVFSDENLFSNSISSKRSNRYEDRTEGIGMTRDQSNDEYYHRNIKQTRESDYSQDRGGKNKIDRNFWNEEYVYEKIICNSRSRSRSQHGSDNTKRSTNNKTYKWSLS